MFGFRTIWSTVASRDGGCPGAEFCGGCSAAVEKRRGGSRRREARRRWVCDRDVRAARVDLIEVRRRPSFDMLGSDFKVCWFSGSEGEDGVAELEGGFWFILRTVAFRLGN